MALEKDISLPVSGGFVAKAAYLYIGKVSENRRMEEVSFVIEAYRDRAARLAHAQEDGDLTAATKRMEDARAAYEALRVMPIGGEVTPASKAAAFLAAEGEFRDALTALDAMDALHKIGTNHPFREYPFTVASAMVKTDGNINVANLYAHAKATHAELADASDC